MKFRFKAQPFDFINDRKAEVVAEIYTDHDSDKVISHLCNGSTTIRQRYVVNMGEQPKHERACTNKPIRLSLTEQSEAFVSPTFVSFSIFETLALVRIVRPHHFLVL